VTAAQEDPVPLRLVGDGAYADWDELYNDNVVRLYRLLYSKVGNRQDAEDLTTEVFLAATARTVLSRYWRARVGSEVTVIEVAAAARFLDDPAPESDAAARARALLAELPERYRRILELRFLEARTIKEAAAEMGITVANAKVLQHRALRQAGAARAEGLST
jgi:DNA-directed RNA polymerase specialized sigma24 family protein